ncbi:peptidase M48 [Marivirga tractuosa]|uniref:Ste24 endopeptidase n=1 Tax=Marivirga tractuosa (strain ATCC 23168 / DSM 4126 / NBRC 15989 / NCIMB 1408 / VKM B-1430 / H-43) TaxID=643867 RepID=E4TUN7_MARTH|nr:M48 family metallopeptidase [Marivirga tractuosa]ADR23130.1 Ste24 endopeptidase [Marivirga tractuosa DSM 4126]BDD16196.1 peptidase M48 [Marivirga tractuosa]
MIFTADQFFTIIIVIVVADYAINTVIDILNLKKSSAKLPEDLKEIYDEEKYLKAVKYQKANTKFGLLSGFSSVLIMFLVLYFGILGELDSWIRVRFDSVVTQTLAFFGIVYIINDIWNIPWQWYSTFTIEEKFGFNKLTPALFWKDKLKGYLLTALLGGILLSVLILLIMWLGQSFWWIFWLVIVLFMIGANFFYTSWILPLFNKLTPLEDGTLREKILQYGKSVNFPIENIYIMDGSKRSSKANAFFSGFGKRKKIVLFDTLLEKHTDEELVAILAHEVGHYKKKHTISGMISGVVQTGAMLLIMSYMIFNPNLSIALGAEQLSFPVNFIAFGIIYTPVSMILSLFSNFISRKHEFQADKFAANTYNGEELQNALKKLSIDSLSNLKPHKLYVIFHYSHPPLLQRLQAIDKHK